MSVYRDAMVLDGHKLCDGLSMSGVKSAAVIFKYQGTAFEHDKSLRDYIESDDIEADDLVVDDSGKKLITIDVFIKQ